MWSSEFLTYQLVVKFQLISYEWELFRELFRTQDLNGDEREQCRIDSGNEAHNEAPGACREPAERDGEPAEEDDVADPLVKAGHAAEDESEACRGGRVSNGCLGTDLGQGASDRELPRGEQKEREGERVGRRPSMRNGGKEGVRSRKG